jgi:mono/diheme cytochrome c family protein
MRRWLGGLAALVLLGLAGYGLFAWVWGVPSVADHPVAENEKSVAAGRYLAAAGDCTSCHTAEGGEAFAGGRPFDTPFGRLYSRNITPDPRTGIGGMNSADFYQLMVYGADSVFSPLYPAMPYTSFHNITRADSDALFAYFMSVVPVEQEEPPNELAFPFNIRPLMFGWNLLFASRGPFEADPQKDAVWNRGAYLVEGLGHCGECHTPRNVMGAMEAGKSLEGAMVEDLEAPAITPESLAARGWNREDLVLYFQTGAGPQGTAFGEMFLVVKNSLRHLEHGDLVAIATYLMDVEVGTPGKGEAAVAALGDDAHENRSGQTLYLSNCSLCHGPQGRGIPSTMPALKGNATVAQPDGVNLVTVIARGLDPQKMDPTEGYGPMPGFADRLSNAQIAELANYVRSAFSDTSTDLPILGEADVGRILN